MITRRETRTRRRRAAGAAARTARPRATTAERSRELDQSQHHVQRQLCGQPESSPLPHRPRAAARRSSNGAPATAQREPRTPAHNPLHTDLPAACHSQPHADAHRHSRSLTRLSPLASTLLSSPLLLQGAARGGGPALLSPRVPTEPPRPTLLDELTLARPRGGLALPLPSCRDLLQESLAALSPPLRRAGTLFLSSLPGSACAG
jgi:hypothetical protein